MIMRLINSVIFVLVFNSHSVAHEYRRETSLPLQTCNLQNFTDNLPLTHAYLNNLYRRLVESNSDVFHNDLAPDQICIGAQYSSAGGRAWAESDHRTIRVETSLINRAQNDAQLAVVIGHELAHISLRHDPLDGTPVTGDQREVVRAALRERREVLNRITARPKSDDSATEYSSLNSRDEALRDQINDATTAQLGADTAANWTEGEADLIGMHFYLRSGFTSAEVGWRQQQVVIANANDEDVHGPPPAISASERAAQAYQACGVTTPATMSEPERGQLRYPSECWTIWKLLHSEPSENTNYRQLLNDNRSDVNISTEPTLEQVKAEISAYVQAPLK